VTNAAEKVKPTVQRELLILLCVGSFVLYALAVLVLHQERAVGWNIEVQGPIPSALSHLLYRTPLGAVDSALLEKFIHPEGASVQDIIAAAVAGSIPRGATIPYTLDGNGAAANLFGTLAMWTFGPRISSLILFYLTFVGISALAFVCRYRDQRLIVVPLYFLVVTIMLLTPLSTSNVGVDQNAIGGIRYFVLAALLPALHIYFELLDRSVPMSRGVWIRNSILLFIQGLLFFAAFFERSSIGYLIGTFVLALAWRLYRDRIERSQLVALASKTAMVAVPFAVWAIVIVTAMPAYVHSGRVFGVFWHRAFVSLSDDPQWPFGDLNKVYACTKDIPEGLSRGQQDRNAQCVWVAYPPNRNRPQIDLSREIYDGNYERVVRNAFFYVVTHYPRQTFDLYFHVKPQQIEETLLDAWNFLLQLPQAPVAKREFLLVAGQSMLFVIFAISAAFAGWMPVNRLMVVFPLLFLLSLAPRLAAWASWMTGADLIFLMYSCLILGAVLAVQLFIILLDRLDLGNRFINKRGYRSAAVSPAPAARSVSNRQ
jgi:hypothetical protein